MPLVSHIATVVEPQIRPRHRPERKTINRAMSVPVGQEENWRLESLRPRKQKISPLGVEHVPSPGLSSAVTGGDGDHNVDDQPNTKRLVARGRKRDLSSCFAPQADGTASTSPSMGVRTADANERRPQKRHKRSSSTPAASKSSQLSTQLRPRRRSRSGVDSPTTDVENTPRSRGPTRLSRKIYSFIGSRNLDIYTHLASPDGPGNLLNKPSASSVVLSTPIDVINPQSTKRPNGRRKTIVNLGDESAKRDLMEEWARMRQSQGTLPFSGRNENASVGQMPLPVSSALPEAIIQKTPDLAKSQTNAITSISQSQQTILDVSPRRSPATRTTFEHAFPVGTDASGNNLDSVQPSDGKIEQPVVDIGAPTASILVSHTDEDSSSDKTTVCHPELLHRPGSAPLSTSASPSREDYGYIRRAESMTFPVNEVADAVDLNDSAKDGCSLSFPQTYSFDASTVHLDADEEFYMLDIPEIFTLPWVPVSSQLYVPPGVGKLISGMREQLTMEARARRRAEGLYQAELSRRMSAEKVVHDLRAELEKHRDLSRKQAC